MKAKVESIKKLENGNLAVKWAGSDEYKEIKDKEVAAFLVYALVKGKEKYDEEKYNAIR